MESGSPVAAAKLRERDNIPIRLLVYSNAACMYGVEMEWSDDQFMKPQHARKLPFKFVVYIQVGREAKYISLLDLRLTCTGSDDGVGSEGEELCEAQTEI